MIDFYIKVRRDRYGNGGVLPSEYTYEYNKICKDWRRKIVTIEFYTSLVNGLSSTGWVVWNTWVGKVNYEKQRFRWKKFFNTVLLKHPPVKAGNIVMFGGKINTLNDMDISDRIQQIQNRVPIMGIKKDIQFDGKFIEI